MTKDEIFEYYLSHLQNRLDQGRISKGSFALLKISESSFIDYAYSFEMNEQFREIQIELYKSVERDNKINNLFDGTNGGN